MGVGEEVGEGVGKGKGNGKESRSWSPGVFWSLGTESNLLFFGFLQWDMVGLGFWVLE